MNNRVDERTTIVIDPATFDWDAASAKIDAYGYRAEILARVVHMTLTQAELDGLVDEEAERAKHRDFLAVLKERVADPDKFVRDTDNYDTFGFGFDYLQIKGALVLTGSYNDHFAAAGEYPEDQIMESEAFDGLVRVGAVELA